jgi:hypothetical protein
MSQRSAISRQVSALRFWFLLLPSACCLLPAAFCLLPTVGSAEEIIFLQDGRTIRADKVEIVGDRVRIERPSETIELPRSEVLSIHPISPPQASPGSPAPSDVYRDLTPQSVDKIRREIQDQAGPSQRR